MINDVMENAIGGLIASETHGLIALLLCRISEELKLAWGFQAELEELQDQLTFLSELINGASCQPVTSSWVRKWLNKIKDAAEEADDLVDEWSYETLKSRLQTRKRDKLIRGVTYPVARLVMAHRVRDLRKSISNIYNDAQKNGINPIKVAIGHYNNKSSQGDSQQRRPQYRQWVGDELLLGRDEDITNLVSLLCDPSNKKSDLNVIGIVGLAGLGKTALSKRVSKLSEVTSLFNSMVIWLVISHSFDLLDSLNRMVEIIFGEASNMKDKQALLVKLQGKLKGKRYFLILDDVWDTDFWESFLSSLLEIGGSKGTTILVTSRDKIVVEKMKMYECNDCRYGNITVKKPFIYSLGGLSEVDSWSLLMARIGDDNLASSGRKLIAARMLKNCGGVPLAIRALGDLLREKSVERWKEIGESHLWKIEDECGVLPCLKLSFDYLPNMAVKRCFSYCAIFEEDEVIKKDQLIYMWMAHGFLQPYDEMELKGEEYFKILLNSSLFQEAEMDEFGNVMTFKMHDLVLALARDVSEKEFMCLNKSDESNEVRHLSTSCFERKVIPKSCKKLRTCFINDSMHRFDNLLDFSSLRVLSLKVSWNESGEWGSLCSLKHLRYLYIVLGDCSKMWLPEQITKLYHLQTLWITLISFATTPDNSFLPKEIGNLVNLRHIHVDHVPIGIPAVGLGQLTALQTLPVITLKQDWGGRLSELGKLNDLRDTLEIHSLGKINCEEEARSLRLGNKSKLERLVLKWDQSTEQCYQNKILDVMQPHENIAMLELNAYCGTRFPRWLIDNGTPLYNLVSLKLLDCFYAEGNLKLEDFKYLRFLSVIKCIKLTISFPVHGFQCCKLFEVLEIDDCHILEQIPDLTPLSKLRVLDISVNYAARWKLVGLSSLPCLRVLRINLPLPDDLDKDSPVCKSLHSLSLGACFDDHMKTLPVQLQHLVALQNLKISGFKSVETLPDWLKKLTSLTELKVDSMPKLRCLPSLAAMHCLTNLKTFSSYECPVLSVDLRNQSGEWFKIGHICGEILDDFELIPGFSSECAEGPGHLHTV